MMAKRALIISTEKRRICKECGITFEPGGGVRKYCSVPCRRQAEYRAVNKVEMEKIDFNDRRIPKVGTKMNSNGLEWVMHALGQETFVGLKGIYRIKKVPNEEIE